MESNHEHKDLSKKPTQTEAVEDLISKKQAEKAAEGMRVVQESAAGIQSEVAEVMGGVEAPKEKISERKGESGEQGDIKASSGQATAAAQQLAASMQRRALPTHEIMIKKIRTAIKVQIKEEVKKAKKLSKHLDQGSAEEYNTSIRKIRRLQETLKSLLTSTVEVIKSTYFKYFSADGRRKSLEEL
ncbi:MAG: hypothetical protein OEY44_04220 [Candidatus Peregrinibacteria bacterium]|nr:hypothetical protein [Candidatus Peregrinibacteria bacterium]